MPGFDNSYQNDNSTSALNFSSDYARTSDSNISRTTCSEGESPDNYQSNSPLDNSDSNQRHHISQHKQEPNQSDEYSLHSSPHEVNDEASTNGLLNYENNYKSVYANNGNNNRFQHFEDLSNGKNEYFSKFRVIFNIWIFLLFLSYI